MTITLVVKPNHCKGCGVFISKDKEYCPDCKGESK